MTTPRIRMATNAESEQVLRAVCKHDGTEYEDFIGQDVYIRENYTTGCPGYVGQVAIVHWDGSPAYVSICTMENGEWRVESVNDQ